MRVLVLFGVLFLASFLLIYIRSGSSSVKWNFEQAELISTEIRADRQTQTKVQSLEVRITYEEAFKIFDELSTSQQTTEHEQLASTSTLFDASPLAPLSTTSYFTTEEEQSSTETPTTPTVSTTTESVLCPRGPIVSATDSGRLGNKIWEYAATWAVARLLGRPGFVPRSLLDELSMLFSNLSLKAIEDIEHCNIQFGAPLKNENLPPLHHWKKKFKAQNLLLAKYIFLPEPVLHYRNFLHEEFQVRPDLLREVQDTIESLGVKGRITIGVHVRRTDYGNYLPKVFKAHLVDADFFKSAMKQFRENIPGNLTFLIVSDDVEWCQNNLLIEKDVVIASKSPEHDMALLISSNHSIIDYGTFGFWGAFMGGLKGGHTISLSLERYFNRQMAKVNRKWHLLKF